MKRFIRLLLTSLLTIDQMSLWKGASCTTELKGGLWMQSKTSAMRIWWGRSCFFCLHWCSLTKCIWMGRVIFFSNFIFLARPIFWQGWSPLRGRPRHLVFPFSNLNSDEPVPSVSSSLSLNLYLCHIVNRNCRCEKTLSNCGHSLIQSLRDTELREVAWWGRLCVNAV